MLLFIRALAIGGPCFFRGGPSEPRPEIQNYCLDKASVCFDEIPSLQDALNEKIAEKSNTLPIVNSVTMASVSYPRCTSAQKDTLSLSLKTLLTRQSDSVPQQCKVGYLYTVLGMS